MNARQKYKPTRAHTHTRIRSRRPVHKYTHQHARTHACAARVCACAVYFFYLLQTHEKQTNNTITTKPTRILINKITYKQKSIHTNTQSRTKTHKHTNTNTHTDGEVEKHGQAGQEKENRAAALPTLPVHVNATLQPSKSGAPP